MGLFKSNSIKTNRHSAMQQRKSYANQQVKDLRYKAKSKLIGAVVLAIAGIIALPFIFSNEEPLSDTAPQQAPLQAATHQLSISTGTGVTVAEGGITSEHSATTTISPNVQTPSTQVVTQVPSPTVSIAASTAQYAENTNTASDAPKTVEEKNTAVATSSKKVPDISSVDNKKTPEKNTIKDKDRTDDGALALALLEGKKGNESANRNFPTPATAAAPVKPAAKESKKTAPSKGQYVVQVGSYTTREDAQSQLNKLSGSGVSNVFIQQATVNNRQAYRLRVGPFISKESAQAALTRLRGLGRGDGYITSY